MILEAKQNEGYPATVKMEVEGSSLVVQISLKGTWGRFTPPNLCGFYDELEKNVKQASLRTQVKQPIFPPKKLSEEVQESTLPPPCPTPSLSPPQAAVPRVSPPSLPKGKVAWVYVNLREGPGIQHKIIGKAYAKTSLGILAENPGWLRVRLENGTEGWMSKKAVTLDSPLTSSPQSYPAASPDSSGSKPSSKPLSPM